MASSSYFPPFTTFSKIRQHPGYTPEECRLYEVNFYDIDQLNVLLKFAKNSSIYTEILLAVFLGLRRGEVLGLKWDSIDLENRLVKIHMNVTPAKDDTGKETIFIREKMKTKKV